MAARAPRFWIYYAIAWSTYSLIFLLVFVTSGELPLAAAIPASLINTVPSALLGLAAIRVCRRIPWTPAHPARFLLVQVGLAALYGVSSVGAMWVLSFAEAWARAGALSFATFSIGIAMWQLLMAMVVYSAIASVTYTLEIQRRLHEEQQRVARATALQTEAELTALRAQLNPHFLFNTLHTLLSLVRNDPGRAESALEQFGDLLRYALRVQQETIDEGPLATEWKFVNDYLSLEQLRLGDRLRLTIDVDPETLGCVVPVFCLQPLVENAIRHGIAPRAEGGELTIRSRLDDGRVELQVRDDGAGGAPMPGHDGMGLRLVQQRLDALYAREATLEIRTRPEVEGFTVTLSLPARREDGEIES